MNMAAWTPCLQHNGKHSEIQAIDLLALHGALRS